MNDVLPVIIPGGGEPFSAVSGELGGEGLNFEACVSTTLLEDFLWPEKEPEGACQTFNHFKSTMAPGPRHDPQLDATRAFPYTDNIHGVRFDENNLSDLWVD